MKMKKVSFFLTILSWTFFGCMHEGSGDRDTPITKDSLIVFYNLTETSRSELAKSLETIDRLGPKIIAIETIFDTLESQQEDSVLASTLKSLSNVILAVDIRPGMRLKETHPYFKSRDTKEGVLSFVVSEDGTITHYVELFANKERQLPAFADQIVFNIAPEYIGNFLKMRINRQLPINCLKDISQFAIIDKDHLTPHVVQDKIILVGNFGADADVYEVKFGDSKRKTFSAVITANIINNRLSEYRKEDRKVNID